MRIKYLLVTLMSTLVMMACTPGDDTLTEKDQKTEQTGENPDQGTDPGTPSHPDNPQEETDDTSLEIEAASEITSTKATLNGIYYDALDIPDYKGFEWGTSRTDLNGDLQSETEVTDRRGCFSATLTGLSPDTEYFFRAYIKVLVGQEYQTYYSAVSSFRTKTPDQPETTAQPGWFELPAMDIEQSGDYLVSESDNSLYYAMHICPDIEDPVAGRLARNYTVCFDSQMHCPLWVAAPLHSSYKSSGRHEAYRPDPNIPESCQWSAKTNASGYNKGHMLGSSDRNKTTNTNYQVFYYSNIAPQLDYNANEGGGFNTGGGGWNTLEEWVDTKVCSDTLYAVIGCYFKPFGDVYHNGTMVQTETLSGWGRTDVAKPTMFYYVLLRTKQGNSGKSIKDCSANELQCAAFARAHVRNLHGQKVTSKEMMSVSDLEALTGITYFSNVPQAPKNTFTASDWGL